MKMNVYDHIRNIHDQTERLEERACGTTEQQYAFDLWIHKDKIEGFSKYIDQLVNDIDDEVRTPK